MKKTNTITARGLKMNYTGTQINHQSELPKNAKHFAYDYTEDLQTEISIYYTNSFKFYIILKEYKQTN